MTECFARYKKISQVTVLLLAAALSGTAQTLDGAIDMHAHFAPDGIPRAIDAIDLARLAKERGMRAIVLKSHKESTAAVAYLVRKEVPGIEVFGGIGLDREAGGLNAAAVEWMTHMAGGYGRVVWMPTQDAEHQVKLYKQDRPFVRVAIDGKLVPEAVAVIAVIAKHNLVLATGHSSPSEALLLIREAKRQGVQRIVVTHALIKESGPMSIPEMQEAARLGAYLEIVYAPFDETTLQKDADAIRAVGAASFIISSDLGQPTHPLHPDGLLALYRGLHAHGISEKDIEQMSKINPAKLLGLNPEK